MVRGKGSENILCLQQFENCLDFWKLLDELRDALGEHCLWWLFYSAIEVEILADDAVPIVLEGTSG